MAVGCSGLVAGRGSGSWAGLRRLRLQVAGLLGRLEAAEASGSQVPGQA